MIKIKIFAIAAVFLLVGIVLSGSQQFSTSAEGDVIEEIANYKDWQQINKQPIKTVFTIDGATTADTSFIIDGEEVSSFRTGTLNG